MNQNLRRVSIMALILVAALLANLTYVQVFRAAELRGNVYNSVRTQIDEYSRQRGQISAGGIVLANSVPSEGRYKWQRQYPTDPVIFAPVTGFYSQYTRDGVEQFYDSHLNGSSDQLFGQRLQQLFSGRDPRGGNVELTVNPGVQRAGWEGFQLGVGQGPFIGSAVALRPSTGEVLAMVNSPSFDPNPLASHDGQVVQDADHAQIIDPNQPRLNRSVSQTLPPGSTFKVLTTIAALEHGSAPNTPVTAEPYIRLPGTTVDLSNYGASRCAPEATTTLETAFARSCNTAFVELALNTGTDALKDVAGRFGFNTIPEDFPAAVAASSVGDIPDEAALGQSAIGQRDVRVTPLQNAIIAATIANGGKRMEPYLVDRLQAPDLSPKDATRPRELGQALAPETAATLTDLMLKSEQNTAGAGSLPGITIASKTGTAEHGEVAGSDVPYSWYIAFAPDHDIAVAVVVESGPGLTLSATGGQYAAPIGRAMIGAFVNSQGGQ